MSAARCEAVAPGTARGESFETKVEEVRCMLPKGHPNVHAAIVEWPPGEPWGEGWPDGGSVNSKLLSRDYL